MAITPFQLTDSFTMENFNSKFSEANTSLNQMVNPNLLDNWYFANPVNQRGLTTYTGNIYTIDRWRIQSSAGSIVLNDDSITMSATDLGTGYKVLQQYIENGSKFKGMTMTLSVLVSACSGAYDAFFGSSGTTANRVYISNISEVGLYSVTGVLSAEVTDFAVGFRKQTASGTLASLNIVAIKLELGSTQTLAHQDSFGNWILNEIPDYGEQLRKCQRHYWNTEGRNYLSAYGYTNSSGYLYLFVVLPETMRTTPTLVFDDPANTDTEIYFESGAIQTQFVPTSITRYNNIIRLYYNDQTYPVRKSVTAILDAFALDAS